MNTKRNTLLSTGLALGIATLLTALLLITQTHVAWLATVTETFDDWADSSYGNISTYSGSSGEWETNNSMSHSSNARSGNAVRFNDDSSANEYLLYKGIDGNGKDGGIGTISFWYRHWDGDGSTVKFKVQYKVGSGGSWIDIGSTVSVDSTTYAQYSATPNINEDNIFIRVVSVVDDERLLIDDFGITDYTPQFTISKSAPALVAPGEVFTYTLTVKNSTGVTPTTTTITDVLPTGVDFISASDGGTKTGGAVTWSVSNFADGATISRTFMVTATGSHGDVLENANYYVNGGTDWLTTTTGTTVTTQIVGDCNSIYNIQYPGGDSLCKGETVAITGVVYAVYGSNSFAIADASGPWHGLYVYDSGVPMPTINDTLLITGTVDEYSNLTQLENITYTVLSTGTTPYAASVVDSGDIATGGSAAESYEGVLVEVHDSTVTNDNLGYGEWSVDDGSGDVRVDDLGSYSYVPTNGDALAVVRGMLYYSHSNYKIEPRDADDIVSVTGSGLRISKDAPALVAPGELFTYTLTVENQTGQLLSPPTVSDTLPLSATYAGSNPAGAWNAASHTITWTAATSLSHGSALSYTVVVTAPTAMTTLVNDDYTAQASNWPTAATGSAVNTLVYDCNSIYNIQHVDNPGSDDASLCMGETVTVEGTVYATYAYKGFFIADAAGPWHGIYVYYPSDTQPEVGDAVSVAGTVKEHYGLTELGNYATYTVLSSGNTPYAPSVVTAAQIPYDNVATSEQYEGVFVETHDITVTAAIDSHGIWDFSDVGGGTGKVDDWGYHAEPAVDDTYAILRGALAYDYSAYKVMPRDANDLVTERQISIEKTAAASVDAGELLTYTLTVFNNTGSTLTGLTITDTVPTAHATFAHASDGGVLAGDTISWTAASLPSGNSLSVRFAVTATGTDGDEIWNNTYAAWAANWLTPTAGSPLLTTIGDYIPIYSIQGSGFTSPYDDQQVRTVGVVVGFFEGNYPSGGGDFDGFYIQDSTGDTITTTSDAIFVNHGTAAVSVAVGDLVTVTGTVGEFSEYDGTACSGDTCLTQIAVSGASDVEVGPTATLPTATELDPPGGDVAVAATYWESLEGMLVTIPNTATVVGPTSYNTIMVVRGDLGVERVLRTGPHAGMPVAVRHYKRNGKLDDGSYPDNLIVGSTVENVDGPLVYSYGSYLVATQFGAPWTTVYDKPAPTTVPTWPAAPAEQFSAATFNTYNYNGGATKLTKVVSTVVGLGAPTFLSLEEISVADVITDVITALNARGYPYAYAYSHPDVGGHGVAVLWRTDRVTDVTWSTEYQGCSADGSSSSTYDPLWATCQASGEYPLFSRRPVVVTGTVTYAGNATRVIVIGNHFKSKRGGDPSADQRRLEQGQFVAGLVDGFITTVPNVLVLGDLNDFEDSPPLEALYASGNLTNTWYTLPEEARYSYIYQGTSQILDHILASPAMLTWLDSMSPMHYNADFPYYPYSSNDSVVWRTSDHDPVVATFALPRYIYLPLVFRNSS